jgi:uncharacterized protein YndB with AHSA1/START domain
MNDPLRLSFDVACSAEHAFLVWTSRINTWWPPDHTVTGCPHLVVVLESGVGGRIYERTSDGAEHDWGQVTVWEPPTRLAYSWHLRQDRADPTEVEVKFVPEGPARTRIEIEHSGWERFGGMADERREQNQLGWQGLVPYFQAAIVKGEN